MNPKISQFITLVGLSLTLLAATPEQSATGLEIPWWVWLIVVSFILLTSFIALLNLDHSNADQQDKKGK